MYPRVEVIAAGLGMPSRVERGDNQCTQVHPSTIEHRTQLTEKSNCQGQRNISNIFRSQTKNKRSISIHTQDRLGMRGTKLGKWYRSLAIGSPLSPWTARLRFFDLFVDNASLPSGLSTKTSSDSAILQKTWDRAKNGTTICHKVTIAV